MAHRVVIAEDEAIIRMDLRELLEEEGYEVVGEAGRGDEAVRLVDELRPDIALFDVKMPGLDGIAAARAVNEQRWCPVVILTAFSQRELIEEATEAGVYAYLVKPFQRNDIVPAFEVALARFAAEQQLMAQIQSTEERFEARKLLDRAKGRLMDDHGMKEAEAFSYLQQTAMRERRTMRVVAEEVLEGRLPDAVGAEQTDNGAAAE